MTCTSFPRRTAEVQARRIEQMKTGSTLLWKIIARIDAMNSNEYNMRAMMSARSFPLERAMIAALSYAVCISELAISFMTYHLSDASVIIILYACDYVKYAAREAVAEILTLRKL